MPSAKLEVAEAPSTRIQRVVSPKGIEAWLVEDYTIPIVALDFAFMGAGALDPEGKSGLTYLMTGLLDEGAGKLDATAFQEKLEDSAIELSFNAGRDRLEGSLRTMQSTLDQAFKMLALAINEPRFDEEALERGKTSMISRLKRGETDADHLTWKALHARAFAGHPYGRPEKGTFASIPTLTRADCVAVHKARMARSRLKVAAVGAISAAELGKGLDRVFASLGTAPLDDSIPDIAIQGLGEKLVTTLDVPQSTLALARPGIFRNDPEFMAAYVVNHILGGGAFTSRLWTEVREKRGLAYSVWSQMSSGRHSAAFFAGTSTSNERVAESLKIIEAECLKMAEKGPTSNELSRALKYLIGSYALRFDSSRKIAGHLVELQIEGLDIDYIARRNSLVAAVTLSDTKKAARRLIGDGKMLVSVCGKPKGIVAG